MSFRRELLPSGISYNRVPMDLTDGFHTFEALLKAGQASYWVDSVNIFSGDAWKQLGANGGLLAIGDTSGTNPGGEGTMYIDHVRIETATPRNHPVPEPSSFFLFVVGLVSFLRHARCSSAQ